MNFKTIFLLALIMAMPGSCADTDSSNICGELTAITGEAVVTDGDTLTINNQKIRLANVDAPETQQLCERKETHEFYSCGIESKEVLQFLVRGQSVTCCQQKLDIYRRILAECFIADVNINKEMVGLGQALLYRNSKAYKVEQDQAKKELRGIWNSTFTNPWEWRKYNKKTANQ